MIAPAHARNTCVSGCGVKAKKTMGDTIVSPSVLTPPENLKRTTKIQINIATIMLGVQRTCFCLTRSCQAHVCCEITKRTASEDQGHSHGHVMPVVCLEFFRTETLPPQMNIKVYNQT